MDRRRSGWLGLVLCAASLAAHAQGVSFKDLARQEQYREAKLSPDGRYIAVVADLNDTPVLSLINLDTLKGVNVYPRDGDDVADFQWVNDHRVIYSIGTKVAGFDQRFSTGELFGVDANGGAAITLFGYRAQGSASGATHIQRAGPEYATADIIDTLPGDDEHVLIGVNAWRGGAEGSFTKAFRMDVRSGAKALVTTAPLRLAVFLADHHGVLRFALGFNSKGLRQTYYRAADAADWSLLYTEEGQRGLPSPLTFNSDDTRVYMTCSAAGAVGAICPWDVATKTMLAPVWTSDSVEPEAYVTGLARADRDLKGIVSMPGYPATSVLAPKSAAIALLARFSKQFPGEVATITSSSDDGSKALVLVSSDEDPGTYYLWSAATGKITALFKRASWINPDAMAAMQPVTFKARDGVLLHGYLSTPPGKERAQHLPLVVFVHGGPFGVQDEWGFDSYVQMMATHGYAVLQVNFRGSGGYGAGFESAGYKQWGGVMQDDVTDATRWAEAQKITDPGHVCIFGGSYGGYAALEGAVKEPDLYACAIGYVGVYDLALMYKAGDIPQSTRGENYLRDKLGDDPAVLAAHSPINQLDHLKAKVMLVVGGRDRRVPPEQGEKLHRALLDRHIAHDWLYQPDEGHGFYSEADRAELFQRIVAFLDHTIGPAAKDPAGAGK